MISCPNCSHQNPDGSTNCEQCYSPLPMMSKCPSCGADVQDDAAFCGSCGADLREAEVPPLPVVTPPVIPPTIVNNPVTPLEPVMEVEPDPVVVAQPVTPNFTQLQNPIASLIHVQTNQTLELPVNLSVIHLGRPNEQIPPDLDLSPFPDSDVVSRVHADIRLEEDGFYYLEDTGSANGTYVNGQKLAQGNRHRLRTGDRFSLGKQDKVSFIFQLPG